jgi:hypothetical protein
MLVRVFEVEYTDEFEAWWDTLSGAQQEAIAQRVVRLEALGRAYGARTSVRSRAPSMTRR